MSETWSEFFRRRPKALADRDELVRRASTLCGTELKPEHFWQDDELVDGQGLLFLALYKALRACHETQAQTRAPAQWQRAWDSTVGGEKVVNLRCGRRMVTLPQTLYVMLMGGKPVDAQLDNDGDTGELAVVKDGRVVARLPKDLVEHLLRLRNQERGAHVAAPVRDDAPGCGPR